MQTQGNMEQSVIDSTATETTQRSPQGLFAGQLKLYIAVALLALAVGFFAFMSFQGAAVYYVTVDELLAGRPQTGETVRVSGKLVPDSFRRESQGTLARFTLAGGGSTLPATYDGIVPELFFDEQSDIVLEGRYDAGGVFQAKQVIVKCPSKYQAKVS